jgi:hypothetical protein
MHLRWGCAAAYLLAGLSLIARPVSGQAPVFRGAVDLVPLAVTVVDRKGQPVTGLRPPRCTSG